VEKKKLLIPYDMNNQKYYPLGVELPYEASGKKLRDEIISRVKDLNVVWATTEQETLEELNDVDYMVAGSITKAWLDQSPKLRWIQICGAGIDHFFKLSDVTLEELGERGIIFSNSTGVNSVVVSEQAMALMLMLSRQMLRAMRQQMRHEWDIFCADELCGRTVGIIGLGAVGGRVASLTKCFGMRVIGTKRNPASYDGPADEVLPAHAFRDVLRQSDYVVLACPITDETRSMIEAKTLALMKSNAYLINVARGELVDELALIQALKSGVIARAGLDTFGPQNPQRTHKDQEALSLNSELWKLDNVIICPNNASGTPKIYEYLADIWVENYKRIQAGQDPIGRKI